MKGIRDFILICFIIVLFSIPSFALDNQPFSEFPIYPNYIDTLTYNSHIFSYSISIPNTFIVLEGTQTVYRVYAVSESNDISNANFYMNMDGVSQNITPQNVYQNTSTNLWYRQIDYNTSARGYSGLINVTSSLLNEALPAIRDYLDNGGSSSTVYGQTTISVPRGSVVYIGIPNDGISFSATTTMPIKSGFFSGGWSDSPQRYAYVADLPVSGTTYGKSFGSTIPWVKDGAEGLLGQSFNAKMNYPITLGGSSSTQKYLVIYNPFFYADTLSDNLQDASEIMSSMSVHLSQYTSLKLYKLQQTASAGGITSVSPSNFEQSYEGQIIENQDGSSTVTWEGSDENMPSNPEDDSYNTSEGGLRSITDYLNQITQTLTEFANSFINLLQAPISHVRQLISAGSEYFGVIRGLYSWMPTQVQGLLESAMVVSISIGVISLLL